MFKQLDGGTLAQTNFSDVNTAFSNAVKSGDNAFDTFSSIANDIQKTNTAQIKEKQDMAAGDLDDLLSKAKNPDELQAMKDSGALSDESLLAANPNIDLTAAHKTIAGSETVKRKELEATNKWDAGRRVQKDVDDTLTGNTITADMATKRMQENEVSFTETQKAYDGEDIKVDSDGLPDFEKSVNLVKPIPADFKGGLNSPEYQAASKQYETSYGLAKNKFNISVNKVNKELRDNPLIVDHAYLNSPKWHDDTVRHFIDENHFSPAVAENMANKLRLSIGGREQLNDKDKAAIQGKVADYTKKQEVRIKAMQTRQTELIKQHPWLAKGSTTFAGTADSVLGQVYKMYPKGSWGDIGNDGYGGQEATQKLHALMEKYPNLKEHDWNVLLLEHGEPPGSNTVFNETLNLGAIQKDLENNTTNGVYTSKAVPDNDSRAEYESNIGKLEDMNLNKDSLAIDEANRLTHELRLKYHMRDAHTYDTVRKDDKRTMKVPKIVKPVKPVVTNKKKVVEKVEEQTEVKPGTERDNTDSEDVPDADYIGTDDVPEAWDGKKTKLTTGQQVKKTMKLIDNIPKEAMYSNGESILRFLGMRPEIGSIAKKAAEERVANDERLRLEDIKRNGGDMSENHEGDLPPSDTGTHKDKSLPKDVVPLVKELMKRSNQIVDNNVYDTIKGAEGFLHRMTHFSSDEDLVKSVKARLELKKIVKLTQKNSPLTDKEKQTLKESNANLAKIMKPNTRTVVAPGGGVLSAEALPQETKPVVVKEGKLTPEQIKSVETSVTPADIPASQTRTAYVKSVKDNMLAGMGEDEAKAASGFGQFAANHEASGKGKASLWYTGAQKYVTPGFKAEDHTVNEVLAEQKHVLRGIHKHNRDNMTTEQTALYDKALKGKLKRVNSKGETYSVGVSTIVNEINAKNGDKDLVIPSSAVGSNQIVSGTLAGAVSSGAIKGTDKFDANAQTTLGSRYLLTQKQPNLKKFYKSDYSNLPKAEQKKLLADAVEAFGNEWDSGKQTSVIRDGGNWPERKAEIEDLLTQSHSFYHNGKSAAVKPVKDTAAQVEKIQKTVAAKPAAVKPVDKPVVAKPVIAKPVVKPTPVKPVVAKPIVAKPVVTPTPTATPAITPRRVTPPATTTVPKVPVTKVDPNVARLADKKTNPRNVTTKSSPADKLDYINRNSDKSLKVEQFNGRTTVSLNGIKVTPKYGSPLDGKANRTLAKLHQQLKSKGTRLKLAKGRPHAQNSSYTRVALFRLNDELANTPLKGKSLMDPSFTKAHPTIAAEYGRYVAKYPGEKDITPERYLELIQNGGSLNIDPSFISVKDYKKYKNKTLKNISKEREKAMAKAKGRR